MRTFAKCRGGLNTQSPGMAITDASEKRFVVADRIRIDPQHAPIRRVRVGSQTLGDKKGDKLYNKFRAELENLVAHTGFEMRLRTPKRPNKPQKRPI